MDQNEFKRLYEKHWNVIFRYLKNLTKTDDTAFDLMQDVFIKADKYYNADRIENEKAWLFKIAYNIFLSHVSKKKRDKQNISFLEIENLYEKKTFTNDIHWKMLRQQILTKLEEKNKIFSNLFILRVDEKLTHEQIAAITQISYRTIRRHFDKIKDIIKNNFYDELDMKTALK